MKLVLQEGQAKLHALSNTTFIELGNLCSVNSLTSASVLTLIGPEGLSLCVTELRCGHLSVEQYLNDPSNIEFLADIDLSLFQLSLKSPLVFIFSGIHASQHICCLSTVISV